MFKKFVTIMMVVAIFTVQASAAANNNLKAAFDELSYSLNVEWDQKDRAFYDAQMKKFTDTVSALQTEGLTNAEMIEFLKSEVKDAKAAKDIEIAFNMIAINKMSAADATKYALDAYKKSYSKGASWFGEMTGPYLIGGAVVVGFVLLMIFAGKNSTSTTEGTIVSTGSCTQYYQCNNFCYNDALWGFTCQPSCFYTCY
jgi:hypothetical protein